MMNTCISDEYKVLPPKYRKQKNPPTRPHVHRFEVTIGVAFEGPKVVEMRVCASCGLLGPRFRITRTNPSNEIMSALLKRVEEGQKLMIRFNK